MTIDVKVATNMLRNTANRLAEQAKTNSYLDLAVFTLNQAADNIEDLAKTISQLNELDSKLSSLSEPTNQTQTQTKQAN